jgi:hypothetical protein
MTAHAAFQAVFVTCRQVRDEVHFIFSAPAEQGTDYLDRIGGFPKPGESRWCVIARLNSGVSPDAPDEGDATPAPHPTHPQVAAASEPSPK